MSNQPPLNPDALEAMSRVIAPSLWEIIDLYPDDPRTPNYRKYAMDKAGLSMSAYLAAQPEVIANSKPNQNLEFAQPEVNSFDPSELNRRGWTCGCEPGNYDSCNDCHSACNELAGFLNRPAVNDA